MPRHCTICIHAEREEIDKALIRGEPYRLIAGRTDTSCGALQRHKAEHLPAVVTERVQAEVEEYAISVLRDILETREDAKHGARDALDAGRFAGAGTLLAVRLKANELLAELEGKLNRTPQVNLLVQVRDALADLPPEVRTAVADRLDRIGA